MKIHYHSDHLGSASFVTNAEGAVVQHLQYLPYGELFVSQRNSEEFDSRYKFTAKELDNETSYTYFGARYYDSELSGWLSVDPMSDERSWVSPYNYCQWNPIIMVDPNGKIDGWVEGPDGNVFWDPNTNSQEEFNKNYAGKEGYSYASDPDDPRSYTLPTGEGKVIMHQWIEHDIEDGLGGPMIKMEFKPTDNNSNVGWFQTFESNIPDVSSSDCYFKLPDENIVERLDGQYIMNKSDIKQAAYFDNPPSTILEDQPGRFYKEGAKYSVYWKAQSSIIINGKRSFTISWGFTIDSKNSGTYIRPNFVKEPTEFHKNAINYLKFN